MLQSPSSRVAGALAALALTLVTAGSAFGATDFASMSAEERAAFREEVRAFLMEEPEIITEALREPLSVGVLVAIIVLQLTLFDAPLWNCCSAITSATAWRPAFSRVRRTWTSR